MQSTPPKGVCSSLYTMLRVAVQGVLILLQAGLLCIRCPESVPQVLGVAHQHCQGIATCMHLDVSSPRSHAQPLTGCSMMPALSMGLSCTRMLHAGRLPYRHGQQGRFHGLSTAHGLVPTVDAMRDMASLHMQPSKLMCSLTPCALAM